MGIAPSEDGQGRVCFVIMPFSTSDTCTEAEWTQIFEEVIKPAIEAASYDCRRSTATRGNLIKGIIRDLDASWVVLADLTDRNPNVFYELGVRHALRGRTILIAQNRDAIPFDLRSYANHVYDWRTGEGKAQFAEQIKVLLEDVDRDPDRSDNPVSDFLVRLNNTDRAAAKNGEDDGVAVGFVWLQSVTIEESPVFARGSTLRLARTTVVVGGNASGKTALCELFAGSGDILRLKRWSAHRKLRGRTQVRFDAVTPSPLTWTIRVFGESDIKFEMNGQAVPRLNLPYVFVYVSEQPHREQEETTTSYLARWLRVDLAHIHNIVRSLAMRGGFCVHNPRIATRKGREDLLLDLDGIEPGLEFRSLSGSEQCRVAIEFAVEIARFEAEQHPTIFLIDCMGGFDSANFQEYLEFFATQSERVQSIITDRHSNVDRLDRDIEGLRISRLHGRESNVEIS